MPRGNTSNLVYQQHGDMDYILEERGNMFMAARMVSWTEGGAIKLDIRNYYVDKEGNEKSSGGFRMDPDGEAPGNLALALLKENYADTEDVINSIKNRQNFMPSLVKCLNENPEQLKEAGINPLDYESEYYDPTKELFAEGE